MTTHWTTRSTDDYVYRISSDFALQLENKMDEEQMSQSEFAALLGVTDGRVSQILRNPGNLTLKKMVESARALSMKVSIVAYDDDDPTNKNGPINSQIFTSCWIKAGKPRDFFSLQQSTNVVRTEPTIFYVGRISDFDDDFNMPDNHQFFDFGPTRKGNTAKSLIFQGAR